MQSTPDLVERFITYLETERHFSDHTALSYKSDLVQFFGFLGSIGQGDIASLAINADDTAIASHVAKLKRQNYSIASIDRKIAALRSFYKWMLKLLMIQKNPTTGISLERRPLRTVKLITPDQLRALLAKPDTSDFLGARDVAIIQLICSTGIKTNELVMLDQRDAEIDSNFTSVRVRGRNARTLELDSSTVLAFRRYLKIRHEVKLQDPTPLFINKHGTRMSGRSIRRNMNRYCEMAGIGEVINPMTLRHTYTHHLISNGVTIKDVAELLGNRSSWRVGVAYAS